MNFGLRIKPERHADDDMFIFGQSVLEIHKGKCYLYSCTEWNIMNYVNFPDAEYEFVGMGNRHIPTKCIALGMWDNPGNKYKFS